MNSDFPLIVGSGLLALDLVLPKDAFTPEKVSAGGSCGNVMSALAWMGWNSLPIASVGDDRAGDAVRKGLLEAGVSVDGLIRLVGGTPIIVHRYGLGQPGDPRHRWEWVCPVCSRPLPRYKPLAAKRLPSLELLNCPRAFYFDRATPAALVLAKHIKDLGGVIFFEPPKMVDTSIFNRCLAVTDVLKVSGESVERSEIDGITPDLVIRSLGNRGLDFRLGKDARWNSVSAFAVDTALDTAGCGDWLSSGFIFHHLGGRCRLGNSFEVHQSLLFGQAVAAISSMFVGSRGVMDAMDAKDLIESAVRLAQSGQILTSQTRIRAVVRSENYTCPMFC